MNLEIDTEPTSMGVSLACNEVAGTERADGSQKCRWEEFDRYQKCARVRDMLITTHYLVTLKAVPCTFRQLLILLVGHFVLFVRFKLFAFSTCLRSFIFFLIYRSGTHYAPCHTCNSHENKPLTLPINYRYSKEPLPKKTSINKSRMA